jgi:arginyl-tRNA synthetase
MGDVAFGCFALAKTQGKSPAEIAKDLAAKLKTDETVASFEAAGPYVNIRFQTGMIVHRILGDIDAMEADFGKTEGGKGKEVLFEGANPNTHKEIHVGHLRHLILGVALHRILNMAGWKVIPISYHGDVGAHVSKGLWFFVRAHAHLVPRPKQKKGEAVVSDEAWVEYVLAHFDATMVRQVLDSIPKDRHTGAELGRLYKESTRLLTEHPEYKDQISEVQRALESYAPGWTELWRETRRWSVDEMSAVFQELGVSTERQYFESEVMDAGQRIVDDLLSKGVARMSEGAVIVDLEDQKLGVFLIRKSDGTSLYATKDLELAYLKAREYPGADRSILLVDARQSHYFRQLFATLKLMGYRVPMEHISYEFLTLKTGAMSSREGNIVTWQSFRDEVMNYARVETRNRHPEWPEGRVEHTAWCLAMGGIKYGLLKQDSDKVFVFDLERALSFDGDTGPYIQYAATRLRGILKKAGVVSMDGTVKDEVAHADLTVLSEEADKRLALHLAALPQAIERAAAELRPTVLAQWCLLMSHRITEFYRDATVIDAPPPIRLARLRLVSATSNLLTSSLELLGIPVPEEM